MSLLTNLQAYWKLDESSGNATDSTGNGNTLTNTNVTYGTGIINNGAVFNSTTDSLSTTNETPFDFERTSPWSMSLWVNLTSLTGGSIIIDHENVSLKGYMFQIQSNGKLRIQYGANNDGSNCIYVDSTNSDVSTGSWHHIVLTYSGSSAASGFKFYVNNTAVSMTTLFDNLVSSMTNTSDVYLGNRIAGGNDFAGTMDEVGIWSRELTSGEVSTLYNGGAGLSYDFSGGTPAFVPKTTWFI